MVKKAIITRFPPEPSGHMHLGHLKSIWYNYTFAKRNKKQDNKFVLRFDDANPETCSQEYVNTILNDLKYLNLTFDNVYYMSDYFDKCQEFMTKLITSGDAYVDTNDNDVIRESRIKKERTNCFFNTVEENLRLWNNMISGTKHVVRLKIDKIDLIDPIVYRVCNKVHYRTGIDHVVYPLFDFISPISDYLNGITHIIRTTEFKTKEKIHRWILRKLELDAPIYKYFCRYNLEYSLLSKRKLLRLINDDVISDWNSPIMPTITGLTRRGFLMETFHQYFSKFMSFREHHSVEHFDDVLKLNRKLIDSQCTKIFASNLTSTEYDVIGCDVESDLMSLNAKNKGLGKRTIVYPKKVLIDNRDANLLENDDKVFLIGFGSFTFKQVSNKTDQELSLNNQLIYNGKSVNIKDQKYIISWLNPNDCSKVECIEFGNLLSKKFLNKTDELSDFLNKDYQNTYELYVDNYIDNLKKGTIIQLIRFGYYRIDSLKPLRLIHIKEPGNSKQYLLK